MRKLSIVLMFVCALLLTTSVSFAKGDGECKRQRAKDGSCEKICAPSDCHASFQAASFSEDADEFACDGSGGKRKRAGKGDGPADGSGKGDCKKDGSCKQK